MTLNDFLPHIDRIPAVDTFISIFMPLAQVVYVLGVLVTFVMACRKQMEMLKFLVQQVREQARASGVPYADDLTPPLRYYLFAVYLCAVLAVSWPLVVILKPEVLDSSMVMWVS